MNTKSARVNLRDSDHSGGLVLAEMSDDDLAGAAAVGDQEAFEILVTRLSPGLLRYLRRMVTDPQIAEDLLLLLLDNGSAQPLSLIHI